MQILRVENSKISNRYFTYPQKKSVINRETAYSYSAQNYYNPINFGAKIRIIDKKIPNIELEKNRILKHLDELLNITAKEIKKGDFEFKTLLNSIGKIEDEHEMAFTLLEEFEKLKKDRTISDETKLRRMELMKKFAIKKKRHSNISFDTIIRQNKQVDESYDYKLLNKFKNAINENDFRLSKIYKDYFQGLNKISTIEDLNKKYPSIKTPPRPENIIAGKIIDFLTKDFFLEYEQLLIENPNSANNFLKTKLLAINSDIAEKFNLDLEDFNSDIEQYALKEFRQRYEKYSLNNFSSIPEYRKNKLPDINDIDISLLQLDFDDFVISTIKKHYLGLEKVNQIKHRDNFTNRIISINSLSNTEYKFEKFPDKIRHIISSAGKILEAQRSYNLYNLEYLKEKLDFYSGTEIGNNEKILEKILDFDTSEEQDKKDLILFIKELDKIYDGEQTSEAALETMHREDIRPHELHRINEAEQQIKLAKIKHEQDIKFKLDKAKDDFDNAINLLYANDLANIASTCTYYRPKQYSPGQIGRAEYLVNLINSYINTEQEPNIAKLEHSIKCWDTYYQYSKLDLENPTLKKAKNFAKENNSINIIKAGEYLINHEIVETYPESLDFVEYPELLVKIIERAGDNKELAINYLYKLNNYQTMDSFEKTFITNILPIFNLKDNTDKQILKYIIENDYINTDSTLLLSEDEVIFSGQEATIATEAKQAIYEKYKFPNCVDLFKNFEYALSSFARAKGESGIKQIGNTKKNLEYKMELKLNKLPDRLFSSKNNLYFDIYSEKGLH